MWCFVLFWQDFDFVVLNLHAGYIGKVNKGSTLLAKEKVVGFAMVISFLRRLLPKSQPGFPEGADSCWLLELIER